MSANDDIRNSIKEMAKGHIPYSVVCEVLSVTGDKCDCKPLNGNADLLNVKLQASTTTGILITPTIGSIVIVTLTGNGSGFVSMFSDIDSIQLNGDNYEGLVKINDLVTKLNNLETKVNTMITTFNAHTHPYINVAIPATTSPTPTLVVGSLTPTVKADLENTTILHGNG